MFLQRKALYNLIQLNIHRINSKDLKINDLQNWQTTNYRDKSTDELFERLRCLGIILDLAKLEACAAHYDAPEDVVEVLAGKLAPLEKDQIFLPLFELWRRLFPEKRSLSIFCDELDYQIMCYDLEQSNEVQDALAYLQQILDEQVDLGVKPLKAFEVIQAYCANDLESFIFDYILEQIDGSNNGYAADLIEGMDRYIKDKIWFDYLRARTAILEEPIEGHALFEKIIKKVNVATHLDLVEEMLYFCAQTGNRSLFYPLAKKTLPILETEEEFQEFMEASYALYDYLELKQPSFAIAHLFHSRKHIAPDQPLLKEDAGVSEMKNILLQFKS